MATDFLFSGKLFMFLNLNWSSFLHKYLLCIVISTCLVFIAYAAYAAHLCHMLKRRGHVTCLDS